MLVPMIDGRAVFLRPVAAGVAVVDEKTGTPCEPGLYLAELRLPSGEWTTIAPTVAIDGAGLLVYSNGDRTRITRAVAEGQVRWVYKVEEVQQ